MLASSRFRAIAVTIGLACTAFAQRSAAGPDDTKPTVETAKAAAETAKPAAEPAKPAVEPAPPAPPAPLPTPAMAGPLVMSAPFTFDGGPLGKVQVTGMLSGIGMWTGNHAGSDTAGQTDLGNGQVFIQKTDGWLQYYIQVGAYNIAALGAPYLDTKQTVTDLWGPVPIAFVKFVPAKNTSIMVGSLPTVIGAEYTFSFENMNIDRGLLWNQENAINRGIQVNQTMGNFTAWISWNDGFYSNRYTWVTGSLGYTKGPHSLVFAAGGNAGQTAHQSLATPVQNNGSIYNAIYTYTKGRWIVQPYWQYSKVPTNPAVGVLKGGSTQGGAILVSRAFRHGFSLPFRWEYIASSGSAAEGSVNLMFGPGSRATSFTLTPTWQKSAFFIRGDLAYVHAMDITPGSAFGADGRNANQPRAMVEFGFLFGRNLEH